MKFIGRILGPDYWRPARHLQGPKPGAGIGAKVNFCLSGVLPFIISYLCSFQRNWIEPGLELGSPTQSPSLWAPHQCLSHSAGVPQGISKCSRIYPNQKRWSPLGEAPSSVSLALCVRFYVKCFPCTLLFWCTTILRASVSSKPPYVTDKEAGTDIVSFTDIGSVTCPRSHRCQEWGFENPCCRALTTKEEEDECGRPEGCT